MTGQPLTGLLERQRGFLFPWVPVLAGSGIGAYFALRFEPSAAQWTALAAALAALIAAAFRLRGPWIPWLMIPALILSGLLIAGLRTHSVAAPVLTFRYYGPIEGRIVHIDRSVSDVLRLTLDRVVLDRLAPDRTPARVRVALHGQQGYIAPEPGMVVILTGHLAAPEGPVEPGGYDFRRQAWFDRLGAVGYTRTPVLMLEPPTATPGLFFARLRAHVSARVQAALPGQAGAFAAVLMTGDRSGLTRATQDDLRASNLSHLLSISGLHMVLLCGSVFAAIRLALSTVPPLALRIPVRKAAAVFALAAGAFYYLLSGGEVPAERAYVMVAVMFAAMMIDRRAISLRSVAIAAIIVLALRPETLVEPGFQMSFAATVALVAAFQRTRRLPRARGWLAPVAAVVLSSAVAGAATAPVAAAHFNRIADYGLIANLLSVPLMGIAVMPAAILTALLMPFGLEAAGLWLMDWPLRWILAVAHRVATLDGAVTRVAAPPALALPLLAAGGLFIVLWQSPLRYRLAGVVPMAAALVLWMTAERPALLISSDGRLLGLMTPEGRALSKPRGQGFTALSWLEDDGDAADQKQAATRPGLARTEGETTAALPGLEIRQFSGRGAADRAALACPSGALIILTGKPPAEVPPGCPMLTEAALRLTGAISLRPGPEGPVLQTVRQHTGDRPWMQFLPPAPEIRLPGPTRLAEGDPRPEADP